MGELESGGWRRKNFVRSAAVGIAWCLALGATVHRAGAQDAPWRWGTVKQDACTAAGKRQYSARLWDIPSGVEWNDACMNAPRNVMGIAFAHPSRCVDLGISGLWGEWDVPDSRCAAEPPAPPVRGAEGSLGVDAPLEGFADLHVHQMAQLGFGETIFWGGAFGPPEDVLGPIPEVFKYGHDRVEAVMRDDYVGALFGTATHAEAGYPSFAAWPANDVFTHQQVYKDWLFRAYQGGLRLIVMLAVNNEDMFGRGENDGDFFNQLVGPLAVPKDTRTGNDMEAVEHQVRGAYAMQAVVDAEYGGSGQGWYRIVRDPEEASRTIAAGKLAVVLGIEVDHIFNCDLDRRCSEAKIAQGLDRLEALGVSYLFPVHHKLTQISGAGQFNLLTTGPTYDCRETVEPCAADGLMPLGGFLLREMAARGMLIDVDHTSWRAFQDALDILQTLQYPGVLAGHMISFDQAVEGQTEQAVKGTAFDRIIDAGGMIGLMIGDGGEEYAGGTEDGAIKVPIGCPAGAGRFAQAFLYVRDRMAGGLSGQGGRIGFGTDFNGFSSWPEGRFGADGTPCPAGAYQATNGATIPMPPAIAYPFPLPERLLPAALGPVSEMPLYHWFRDWDFNSTGLDHAGLLPDFIEDLRLHGLSLAELEPLYRSARGFVELWRKARAVQVPGDRHALRWVPAAPAQTLSFTPPGFDDPSNPRFVAARPGRPLCRDGADQIGDVLEGHCASAGGYSAPDSGEILAFHSGRCLSSVVTSAGAAVVQQPCASARAWQVEPLDDGHVLLHEQAAGLCLTVAASAAERTDAWLSTCTGDPGQRWLARRVGDSFQFEAAHNGRCLAVADASRTSGAAIVQDLCHEASHQLWQMPMLRDHDFELLYQADMNRYAWQLAPSTAYPVTVTANGVDALCRAQATLQPGTASGGLCHLPDGDVTDEFELLVQAL